MNPTDEDAKTFGEVLHEEFLEIQQRRSHFQNCPIDAPAPKNLAGLALSGGGVRSATFSLGLLQALNELKLLHIFDYLSTVSGGGFAGGWWSAWLSRDVRKPDELFPPEERIEPERVDDYRIGDDVDAKSSKVVESSINAGKDPIHHLRLFSNYLTPRRGVLSMDTWRAGTSIIRNLILTWLVLLPVLVATVLLGQLYFAIFSGGDFPHENTLMVTQAQTSERPYREFAESFFHPPSDTNNTLPRRVVVAVVPIAILSAISIFFAFCWMLGIQSGPKTLRLLNAIIGLTFLVLVALVFKRTPSDQFIGLTFLAFVIGLISVLFIVFRVPSTVLRFLVAVTRFIKRTYKGSDSLKDTGAQIRAHVATKIKREAKLDRRAEDQWRREVYLNAMTRWTARWLVILLCATAILLISGFGHEAVEYVCCYTTPSGTPLKAALHYAAKSISLSGLFAAVAGVIYTWTKAAPTGGGDKSDTAKPSATSRLIFAITPPLVVLVLAVITAWLAHALLWFIIANRGEGMTGLTMATRVGVYLSFFLVIAEIEWKKIRPWVGSVLVAIALLSIGKIVYPFIPKADGAPLPIWSLRVFSFVAVLALFKPLVARMSRSKLFYKKEKGYAKKFFVLAPVFLLLMFAAAYVFSQAASAVAGGSVNRTPDTDVLEGALKGLARCAVGYFVLILIQIGSRRSNHRAFWLLTSLFVVISMLAVMSYFEDASTSPTAIPIRAVLLLTTTALAWVVTLGWMVDPNSLSLHGFYKGRLVRAYLGASNIKRAGKQKEVTESVEDDDVLLSDLQNCRQGAPYHLINTTLNLVGGRDLATAQRSSAMFVLSKDYCGSVRTGYRRTDQYMAGELSLGGALSVSGAAVSPNMGSLRTTASLAMLMTLLNMRLGYWAPTPNKGRWYSAQARLWPYYMLREFLSETNDLSSYCYLTDGGHFDNTGLYPLIERGCRCVVVADSSADPQPCFSDLGNAIRRCRIDFDTEIDLDVSPFIREKDSFSKQHYVVGTIKYSEAHYAELGWPNASADDRTGIIVYLKPALLEQEGVLTVDVRQYGLQNLNFPQQSTADQWFDEAQFESYRKLGDHTARMAFSVVDDVPAMKEYQSALNVASQGQAPTEEEQQLIGAKLARDRIKQAQFTSNDVLKIFALLHEKRPT